MLVSQALQKDLQANASALNEVISSTKKFLEENRSKLTPEQISALENKLEELKSKANMLNQKAEESRKDLEKVLTSAIKQETEKVRGEKHFHTHYSTKRFQKIELSHFLHCISFVLALNVCLYTFFIIFFKPKQFSPLYRRQLLNNLKRAKLRLRVF